MILLGSIGVVVFAFLSWRALGGSDVNPDSIKIATSAPARYRWAGRISACVALIGLLDLFF